MTTAEEAAEVIQKEKLERAEKCNAVIAKALEEFNCRIDPLYLARAGEVKQWVEIVAL